MPILFFCEETSYLLKEKAHVRSWVKSVILAEGKKLKELNFIFCSDNYLLSINQQYLNHDTYTDIVTFDNSPSEKSILGDIFISIDRVKENAAKFQSSERNELHRVMVHGVLHLLGYKDKTKSDKTLMTQKEDEYLLLRNF